MTATRTEEEIQTLQGHLALAAILLETIIDETGFDDSQRAPFDNPRTGESYGVKPIAEALALWKEIASE